MRTIPTAALAAMSALSIVTAPHASAAPTSTEVSFPVDVGGAHCTIVGELFRPAGSDREHRAPAIMTTGAFGQGYRDRSPFARMAADRGYVVLTFSSLGFGGSTCKVTLADPSIDGVAVSRLVDYLGTLDFVALDGPNDPRVGMVGNSYAGAVQFAAASVDSRIDTLIPLNTWNDLSYSLAPNGSGHISGVTTRSVGAPKSLWSTFFAGYGAVSPGPSGYVLDPARGAGCPNLALYVCALASDALSTGTVRADHLEQVRRVSVATYIDRIKVPTLLIQSEHDTLFDLNEAAATFAALQARGVPTQMIWQSSGHSQREVLPGEIDDKAPDPATQYVTRRIIDWFDHYLRGIAQASPTFAYIRDWVGYQGDAEPAFGTASTYPIGSPHSFALSNDGTLTDSDALPGARSLVTATAGLPGELSPPNLMPALSIPRISAPATLLDWTSAPVSEGLEVVGAPTVSVEFATTGPTIVFTKLFDIDPAGHADLISGLVMPVRIDGPGSQSITLSAIAHRFAPGHRVRLAITGTDVSFRGSSLPEVVSVLSGPSATLTLPTLN